MNQTKILQSKEGRMVRIIGKLRKTGRRVKPVCVPVRCIWIDEADQLWVKIFNKWWKFPEEIEY